MQKKYPVSRKSNIVVQQLNDEVLIYDLRENKAFCLNETSALVWELCDGNKSINEISQNVGKKLKSSPNEDLVWLAIDQLKSENLIENSEHFEIKFNGLSRREVIRKVGLGTMMALPLISTLIAPYAINAASGGAINAGTFAPSSRAENDTCFDASDCVQNVPFGSGCCTGANAPASPGNPKVCRAANVGFNCT